MAYMEVENERVSEISIVAIFAIYVSLSIEQDRSQIERLYDTLRT